MLDPRGWSIEEFSAASRAGVRLVDIIDATLALLRASPRGVLIGDVLTDLARADAGRLATLDPAELPLYGVPFLVKDNIDVGGVPTTAGCPGYSYVAAEDATVVALLRAAGAIVVGKANLDQFATGLVGTRSPFGTPPNTIDRELVPGGSSSGSAVGVALGLVPFALATDTAGSGRVPAALNGVVGLKPTVGSASTFGVVPAMRRFDCPTVFATTVADAASVAAIIRRSDPRDPFARTGRPRRFFRDPPVVGVPESWPHPVTLTDDMAGWFAHAVDRLGELGCDVRPVPIGPLLEAGRLLYGSALVAERTAVVGDAVDKGLDGLDPIVASIIGGGRRFSAVEAYRTEYTLARLRAATDSLFDEIDVLAVPTTPRVATLVEVSHDPVGCNEVMGQLTTFVNVLDLMGVVVPIRPGGRRVPAGLQLIGPAWQDAAVERIAHAFHTGEMTAAVSSTRTPPRTPQCTLAVVGAHLSGLPLNHQLVERGAVLVSTTRTSPDYRLYSLPATVPPKPGLLRASPGSGAEIDVEVWSMGVAEFGSFVAMVPPPLCIGTVQLADGTAHKGFLCEPSGLEGATDITEYGGWRAFLDHVPTTSAHDLAPTAGGIVLRS